MIFLNFPFKIVYLRFEDEVHLEENKFKIYKILATESVIRGPETLASARSEFGGPISGPSHLPHLNMHFKQEPAAASNT